MRTPEEIRAKLNQLEKQPVQENYHEQQHRLRAIQALEWTLGLEDTLE